MTLGDDKLTLISACPRSHWIFHTFTFPGKQSYAERWGHAASFYVHTDDAPQTWDRLRVWQEGLRQVKAGDWMWYLAPGCLIANPDLDWRSLAPFEGDLVISGEKWQINFDSFLLRSTPESHALLERALKLRAVLGNEIDAMVVLIVAETIKVDIRPRRQLASLLAADLGKDPQPPATNCAYRVGDFALQSHIWHTDGYRLLGELTAPSRRAAGAPREGKRHRTHCVNALGDNMAHVHFLRKLAQRYPDHHFAHQVLPEHLRQLSEMTEDLANISLEPLHRVEMGSIDAWKNAALYWQSHRSYRVYADFYVDFFRQLAGRMGLDSPIVTPRDLLFDYPALLKPTPLDGPFDFLVVNSTPGSNQFTDGTSLDVLIEELASRYKIVVTKPTAVRGVPCTQDQNLSVSGIGRLSMLCRNIVMVSTGASWGTFNVWNAETVDFRLILIQDETIGLSKNTEQAASVAEAIAALRGRKLL